MLIYNLARRGQIGVNEKVGGALDRAITPQGESRLAGSARSTLETGSLSLVGRYAGPLVVLAMVAALPMIVEGYWIGLMAQAFAYGVSFLSWTLVTGEGGMLWLCQITFAGIPALDHCGRADQQPRVALLAAIVAGRSWLPWWSKTGLVVGASQHPARRPLCRLGHAHVRAHRREPGVHPAQFREPHRDPRLGLTR